MKRHTCVLCLDDKPESEMLRDYSHRRLIFKCYDCVQDIYECDGSYTKDAA